MSLYINPVTDYRGSSDP